MGTINEIAKNMESNNQPAFVENDRDKLIVRTSIIGIAANVALAAFKAFVGIITNSIAITLDAVNNISDAASSVITIIGTKLAGKDPDKKHPFGYGRIEYLTAMIIAAIVLYAGITSLVESVKKILHPEIPNYTGPSLVIVAVAVVVKIILGRYVKGVGQKVDSDSLINSGEDATLDSIISASTLVAALIFMFTHISLESWLGAIISIVIIKSGIDMMKETISRILGEGVDAELARAIRNTVLEFPAVYGVYDLVITDYGPNYYHGSLHIEIPDTCTADEIDELLRQIQMKVYEKNNVVLTAIGIYSMNTKDDLAHEIQKNVSKIVLGIDHVLQIHGFYLDEEKKTIRYDVVVSFDSPNRTKTYHKTIEEVQKAYPEYRIYGALDTDFSEA